MYPHAACGHLVVGGPEGTCEQIVASGVQGVSGVCYGEAQTGGLVTAFLGKASWAGAANRGLLKALKTPTAPLLGNEPPRPSCWLQFHGPPHLEPAGIF